MRYEKGNSCSIELVILVRHVVRIMNEAETRAELIDPKLSASGWGVLAGSRIRREFFISPGRLEGGGGRRTKSSQADYVLVYRNTQLAVVEAKPDTNPLTEGVAQAKDYAGKLKVRFTYSCNGKGIYEIDMENGREGEIDAFPTPDELWKRTFSIENEWRDRFNSISYSSKGGNWKIRFYQDIAVRRALEAIAQGENRILLTLATGTGKTSIAFQIIWKLFQARWNISLKPIRRPRILFLADRNTLANQAFNDFSSSQLLKKMQWYAFSLINFVKRAGPCKCQYFYDNISDLYVSLRSQCLGLNSIHLIF